jgi:hypothetical protein
MRRNHERVVKIYNMGNASRRRKSEEGEAS